jgi:hypothetical protein
LWFQLDPADLMRLHAAAEGASPLSQALLSQALFLLLLADETL